MDRKLIICFNCLPIQQNFMMYMSLESGAYFIAIWSFFGVLDFTLGPLSSWVQPCLDEETMEWQRAVAFFGIVMAIHGIVFCLISILFFWSINKKITGITVLFLIFLCSKLFGLMGYMLILMLANVAVQTNCGFPFAKMFLGVVYAILYFYYIIAIRSYYSETYESGE